jgi:hypothetical protein
MFMAQHMLFAEHIVKLVDIYGRSCFHSLILNDFLGDFKRFVKQKGLRSYSLTPELKMR